MISGGTSIIFRNVITHVLMDSSKMILRSNSFPLGPLKSQTLVISSQNKPTLSCNRNVWASSEIGNSSIDHGRIGTLIMNKKIWSVDDNVSIRSDGGEADKLTLALRYLQPMKGIQHLYKSKKKFLKVSSLKSLRSQTRANGWTSKTPQLLSPQSSYLLGTRSWRQKM